MKKSIITDDMEHCYICGNPHVQIHHIVFGTGNRQLSDKHGLIVPLCQSHHTGTYGVHQMHSLDLHLKKVAQREFERTHTREEWIEIFGRSYQDE